MTQSTNNELKYITDLLVEIKTDIKDTNKKIDKLDEKFDQKINKLTEDVSELKTDVKVLKANQDNIKEQLSKVDGTQKAQLWSLITLVLGTIGLLAIALFRMK